MGVTNRVSYLSCDVMYNTASTPGVGYQALDRMCLHGVTHPLSCSPLSCCDSHMGHQGSGVGVKRCFRGCNAGLGAAKCVGTLAQLILAKSWSYFRVTAKQ